MVGGMMKKLLVTLVLEVEDLPDDELERHAAEADLTLGDLQDGRLSTLSAASIAAQLNGCIDGAYPSGIASEGANQMLFEGSDLFVRFATAEILTAAFIEGE